VSLGERILHEAKCPPTREDCGLQTCHAGQVVLARG
jgi:hypothetical protein